MGYQMLAGSPDTRKHLDNVEVQESALLINECC